VAWKHVYWHGVKGF